MNHKEAIIGCLLGTAVGDALGLPFEGLSYPKLQKIAPDLNQYHLFFNKGMVSDDTEHTCLVAQSLIISAGEEDYFIRDFSKRLQIWLALLPAGVGSATLRSIFKLYWGVSPQNSGVFSAGNGSAMRSSILGVCYGHDVQKLKALVKLSTGITHSDPKAEYGALTIAWAAYCSSQGQFISAHEFSQNLQHILPPEAQALLLLINQACESASKAETARDFAIQLGLTTGISGYIYHTVPVVIQVWLRHQEEYCSAVQEMIKLGGDTDTTAAILGGIIGAKVGKKGIPQHLFHHLWEYPLTVNWLEKLGTQLSEVQTTHSPQSPLSVSIFAVMIRNLLFLLIVIGHGFLRLKI